jgi:hypothetical protein
VAEWVAKVALPVAANVTSKTSPYAHKRLASRLARRSSAAKRSRPSSVPETVSRMAPVRWSTSVSA